MIEIYMNEMFCERNVLLFHMNEITMNNDITMNEIYMNEMFIPIKLVIKFL